MPDASEGPLLDVRRLTAGYRGRAVIYDIQLTVGTGEVVVMLGSNGAGKTTTLRSVVGHIRADESTILFAGRPLPTARPWLAARQGISLIPSEHFTFAALTVEENLALGAHTVDSVTARRESRDRVLSLFPRLGERLAQKAGTMSGGEQRMLSLGVALMARPRLLLLDEPSLGLAPAVVDQIMKTLRNLVLVDGLSILMVEQNVGQALEIADRTYVMRSGRVILEEPAATTRGRDNWWDLF
jgi:branched-chain amino acid transport system ATP-binding protein